MPGISCFVLTGRLIDQQEKERLTKLLNLRLMGNRIAWISPNLPPLDWILKANDFAEYKEIFISWACELWRHFQRPLVAKEKSIDFAFDIVLRHVLNTRMEEFFNDTLTPTFLAYTD